MSEKKKLFPKLKKQLSNFLTDESGEITKKDALGVAIGATILASADTVHAGHGSRSWNSYNPALPEIDGNRVVTVSDATCSHVSGVVNGHLSQPWQVNMNQTIYQHSNGHSSQHSSHSSHGSGGWC